MRTALTLLLALHGAIHLLGALKWSKLASVPQLSGRTLLPLEGRMGWAFAVGWLAAAALLSAAAVLRVTQSSAWWAVALAGVGLSQGLIVVAWTDAKFGTIANVIVLVPVVIAGASAGFSRQIDREVGELLARSAATPRRIVDEADLERVPSPVRRWLTASGIVGRDRADVVRLRQRGEIRTSPEQAWMSAEAEQYFSVAEPGFVWKVEATMMGVIPVTGRDRLAFGNGHMLIKAASLVNVVDAGDEKIAHGAMLRFLGEIVWFPSAALRPYIEWAPIDDRRATATMRDSGREVSAEFSFDGDGRVTDMRAQRYLGGGETAKLTPWIVTCDAWRRIEGIQVPVRGDVSWKLPSGNFSYYRWEILDIETNRPELYPAGAPRPVASPRLAQAGAIGAET